ncbi:MAG: hypothetical protein SFW36_04150 [Leptolyngbyaceae cyanobacterium bins.59]|nr:hypothetical protein [Leptolyngbyaceae cyanobacterium bins.59]
MSLLDEIRNATTKATVPPRANPLDPAIVVAPGQSTSPEPETPHGHAPAALGTAVPTGIAGGSELQQLQDELDSYPRVSDKKVTLRLEEEVLESLDETCREHGITIETYLEALHTVIATQLSHEQVISDAKQRVDRRRRIGTIRSTLTKLKNLQSGFRR